jgi:hypothetical protein
MKAEIEAYNDAVMKWTIGHGVTGMRLKTFFPMMRFQDFGKQRRKYETILI